MMWLDEIEEDNEFMLSLAKADTNDWVKNNYGKRERMARVLRELAKIIEEEGLDYKWRNVLSDDAKELFDVGDSDVVE